MNALVPAGTATGSAVPLVVTANGIGSDTATIAVQQVPPLSADPGYFLARISPLPNGRGSDAKSRSVKEAIGATTVREWLCRNSEREYFGSSRARQARTPT